MIQFATGVGIAKELAGLLVCVVEDPDTYKKIEGLRVMLSKLTGHEIDKAGLIALLEGVTQGEAYTGKWEDCDPDNFEDHPHAKRLRVAGGWIYDCGRGNPLFVADK